MSALGERPLRPDASDRSPVISAFLNLPVLGALGAVAGTSLLDPIWGFWQLVVNLPFPVGVYPLALLLGWAGYSAVRYLQRERDRGLEIRPLLPATMRPRPAGLPTIPSVAGPTAEARVWRPEGENTMEEPWLVGQPSAAPVRRTRFDRNLAFAFVLLVVAFMLVRHPIFYLLDLVVRGLGTVVFWPLPWPAVVSNVTPGFVVPDYILLMYLALTGSFLLASGVPTGRRYTAEQRRMIIRLLLAYLGIELVVDVLLFTVAEPFVFSAFLLVRGVLGGVFFTSVLLTVLVLPPPVKVRTMFPRDRWVLVTFFGSWGAAATIGVLSIFVMYRDLGLGRLGVAFGILLLLPLFTFIAWTVIGRVLYALEVHRRPPLTISEYHPKVSIIIPAYNEELTIAAAVRSADLAARRYPGEVEIIVGNDGSTDETSATARGAIRRLENATGAVVDLPHGGKSNALNGMLRVATGEIVVRMDADVRISPSVGFERIIGHLSIPSVGGVQGTILPLQTEGWTRRLRFMEIAWSHLFLRRATMATRCAQVVDGAFCAFRREDLLRFGGWVSWNGEDTEITLRLQRMGYRLRFETSALAYEDVPDNFERLERQRIRWFRGGLFAHHRHLSSIFADAPEYGGIAIVFWLALFLRNGLRSLIYIYAVAVALFLPTLLHLVLILGLLFAARGAVIAFYLARIGRWRFVPWVIAWPFTSAIKQHIALKSWGTMLPGSIPEFSE